MALKGVFGRSPNLRRDASYAATTESRSTALGALLMESRTSGAIGRAGSRPGRPATMLTDVVLPIGPDVVMDCRAISEGRTWMGP